MWASSSLGLTSGVRSLQLERVMGIEPTSSAWKAEVLPLNYTRFPISLVPGIPADASSILSTPAPPSVAGRSARCGCPSGHPVGLRPLNYTRFPISLVPGIPADASAILSTPAPPSVAGRSARCECPLEHSVGLRPLNYTRFPLSLVFRHPCRRTSDRSRCGRFALDQYRSRAKILTVLL